MIADSAIGTRARVPDYFDSGPLSSATAADEAQGNAKILEGARRSEPGAMLLAYQRFGPLVNRLVWRLLGADGEHDDIVQQVFLNVFESLDRVRNAQSLKGWIVVVTVNTVRRELRARKLRRIFLPIAQAPKQQPAGDEHSQQKAFLSSCYRLLERLGVKERLVFTLRYVEGCKLEEISRICSCSLATTKRRLQRARKKFARRAAQDPLLGERFQGGAP